MEHIIDIIHRSFQKEATANELEQLERWLSESSKHRGKFQEFKDIWEESSKIRDGYDTHYTPDTERELKKFQQTIGKERAGRDNNGQKISNSRLSITKFKISKFKVSRLSVVASIILLVGIGWLSYSKLTEKEWVTETAQSNEVRQIELEDGTSVWLNRGSSLSYPKDFLNNRRVVRLIGEAYFQVDKDPHRPFIIEGKESVVEVLGTEFNYRSDPKGDSAEVQVIEGRVRFKGEDSSNDELILVGNQKGVYNRESKILTGTTCEADNSIAWKTGVLSFNGMPISSAIAIIESHYNISINIEEAGLERSTLTTQFKQESIEEVIRILEVTFQRRIVKESDSKYKMVKE